MLTQRAPSYWLSCKLPSSKGAAPSNLASKAPSNTRIAKGNRNREFEISFTTRLWRQTLKKWDDTIQAPDHVVMSLHLTTLYLPSPTPTPPPPTTTKPSLLARIYRPSSPWSGRSGVCSDADWISPPPPSPIPNAPSYNGFQSIKRKIEDTKIQEWIDGYTENIFFSCFFFSFPPPAPFLKLIRR